MMQFPQSALLSWKCTYTVNFTNTTKAMLKWVGISFNYQDQKGSVAFNALPSHINVLYMTLNPVKTSFVSSQSMCRKMMGPFCSNQRWPWCNITAYFVPSTFRLCLPFDRSQTVRGRDHLSHIFVFYLTEQEPETSRCYRKMILNNTCFYTKKYDSSKHIFKCFALQLEPIFAHLSKAC